MRLVMLGECAPFLVPVFQTLADLAGQVQLLLEPQRHGLSKGAEPHWCICQIRLKQALEFEEGFVVKADEIQIFGAEVGFVEAIVDGVDGELVIVLLASEPLFLCSRHHTTVDQQGGSRIVVIR